MLDGGRYAAVDGVFGGFFLGGWVLRLGGWAWRLESAATEGEIHRALKIKFAIFVQIVAEKESLRCRLRHATLMLSPMRSNHLSY